MGLEPWSPDYNTFFFSIQHVLSAYGVILSKSVQSRMCGDNFQGTDILGKSSPQRLITSIAHKCP